MGTAGAAIQQEANPTMGQELLAGLDLPDRRFNEPAEFFALLVTDGCLQVATKIDKAGILLLFEVTLPGHPKAPAASAQSRSLR